MDRISLGGMVAKIEGRLLASGCSFTEHCWSTWADILGEHFKSSLLLGKGGSDNATVARSLISRAQPGDTVIALWTAYDRWSFFSDDPKKMVGLKNPSKWQHRGCLSYYNKVFFTEFYHPVERFQAMMDYVKLVDLHSKAYNYKAYHFSAFPLLYAEAHKTFDERLPGIYENETKDVANNYLTEISMEDFRVENWPLSIDHKYYSNDDHPTPLCAWDYLEKIMVPKLGIHLDQSLKEKYIQEQENLVNHGITIR